MILVIALRRHEMQSLVQTNISQGVRFRDLGEVTASAQSEDTEARERSIASGPEASMLTPTGSNMQTVLDQPTQSSLMHDTDLNPSSGLPGPSFHEVEGRGIKRNVEEHM